MRKSIHKKAIQYLSLASVRHVSREYTDSRQIHCTLDESSHHLHTFITRIGLDRLSPRCREDEIDPSLEYSTESDKNVSMVKEYYKYM